MSIVVVCNTRCLFVLLFILPSHIVHNIYISISCSSISSIFVSSQKLFENVLIMLKCLSGLRAGTRMCALGDTQSNCIYFKGILCEWVSVCVCCRHWIFSSPIRYDSIRLDLIFDSIECEPVFVCVCTSSCFFLSSAGNTLVVVYYYSPPFDPRLTNTWHYHKRKICVDGWSIERGKKVKAKGRREIAEQTHSNRQWKREEMYLSPRFGWVVFFFLKNKMYTQNELFSLKWVKGSGWFE